MSQQQRIKLLSDWRGYTKGETFTFHKQVAKELVEQGIGIYANPIRPKTMKNIKEAPKDKMLKGASISK